MWSWSGKRRIHKIPETVGHSFKIKCSRSKEIQAVHVDIAWLEEAPKVDGTCCCLRQLFCLRFPNLSFPTWNFPKSKATMTYGQFLRKLYLIRQESGSLQQADLPISISSITFESSVSLTIKVLPLWTFWISPQNHRVWDHTHNIFYTSKSFAVMSILNAIVTRCSHFSPSSGA